MQSARTKLIIQTTLFQKLSNAMCKRQSNDSQTNISKLSSYKRISRQTSSLKKKKEQEKAMCMNTMLSQYKTPVRCDLGQNFTDNASVVRSDDANSIATESAAFRHLEGEGGSANVVDFTGFGVASGGSTSSSPSLPSSSSKLTLCPSMLGSGGCWSAEA